MISELAHGDDLADVDDAALIDAIIGWRRSEATAAAHRMAAIAELTERRLTSELAQEREHWACDGWDSAAAEIAAAVGIGHRAASTQMHQSLALRRRLPKVAKLLAEGQISARDATTISWRTRLIEDPEVAARVDADLAAKASAFGPMSNEKLEASIDATVEAHDPAAVPRFRTAANNCDLGFGKRDDETGTRSIYGRLTITDAELLQRRVDQLVRSVCPQDPRTLGDRRTAALGVIGAGGAILPCTCGCPDCPAAGRDARADAIVIHLITDQLPDTEPDPGPDDGPDPGPDDGPDPGPDDGPDTDSDDDPEPQPEPPASGAPTPEPKSSDREPKPDSPPGASGVAVITGGGIVPTPLLRELVKLGATVRPVPSACDLGAEPRYRPSAKLTRFVHSRDLTCCMPHCDRPAERCDVDHTIPHGINGLTHPGNTKSLCRKHHLLKTFWTGAHGWNDRQLSDGSIVWISPTGHRYTRPPGSRLYFPRWDTNTPLPEGTPTPAPIAESPERGLTMPTRKHTRAKLLAQRLRAERQRNQRAIDEDQAPY